MIYSEEQFESAIEAVLCGALVVSVVGAITIPPDGHTHQEPRCFILWQAGPRPSSETGPPPANSSLSSHWMDPAVAIFLMSPLSLVFPGSVRVEGKPAAGGAVNSGLSTLSSPETLRQQRVVLEKE